MGQRAFRVLSCSLALAWGCAGTGGDDTSANVPMVSVSPAQTGTNGAPQTGAMSPGLGMTPGATGAASNPGLTGQGGAGGLPGAPPASSDVGAAAGAGGIMNPATDGMGITPPADTGTPGQAGAGDPETPVDFGSGGGMEPTMLPTPTGDCPTIATGAVTVMGVTVQVWTGSGTQPGPLMIYWHGTGGAAATAIAELNQTMVTEIMASGGAIISMESGGQGNPIDWGVYTTGDYDIVDQLVACSIQQLHVDTRRIYTGGVSAGGLAAGTMVYARSGYLAAANPNSGGIAPWPGLAVFQDPSHVPAVLGMHGKMGDDVVVIDFAQASMDLEKDVVAHGGFAVDCDHGGGHGGLGAPPDVLSAVSAAGWQFMKDHPYGTKPSPYAGGLPDSFPSACTTVQ